MKKLIVVVNDLERSGKSSVARSITHHLSSLEVNHLAVTSNEMDMTDTFTGEFWDLEDQFDLSLMIGAIDNHEAIVLDIHTGAARVWGELCEEHDLENLLAELDTEMTLVVTDTRSERCNEEICDITELFADQADYIVAHLPGDARNEVPWKGSLAAKALKYLGGTEVEIPAPSDDLKTALASSGVELAAALNNPAVLPRFTEVPLTQWLERTSATFNNAQDYLIPEAVGIVALDY